MRQILILGAGTGGTIIANALAAKLDPKQYTLTILDRAEVHIYQPGLLFIPYRLYGYEGPEDVSQPITQALPKTVRFVRTEVQSIDHGHNRVRTDQGDFGYDWLVCALGCWIAPDQIEGLAAAMGRNAHTFYTLPDAMAFQRALDDMQFGHLVIDIAELPIKCPVAPIESAFLADYYFHQRGIRDRIEITLVTPYAGVFTRPNTNKVLTAIAQQKRINLVADFPLKSVDAGARTITAYDGRSLSYDLLCVVPPTLGPAVIERSGLGNEQGYIMTDPRTLKSKKAGNIYCLGDNADLPTSKAGSVAHFEAETVCDNLLREIAGKKPRPSFDGHANCFIESGYHKALLVDFNYDVEPLPGKFPLPYLGPFTLLEDTYINHLGKMMFKWVYSKLLITGRLPEIPLVPAHLSLAGKNLGAAAPLQRANRLKVADVMSAPAITIRAGSPLAEAARLMGSHRISGLPVVDTEDALVGVLTEGDLLAGLDIKTESALDELIGSLLRKGRIRKLGSIVDDLMSREPVTIDPGASVQTAIESMVRHQIKRLVVSDQRRQVLGVLARRDLLRLFAG